ncbi:MAG TPA: RsmB/NOP family class I SAM-dependent RNA methyltransferase, partial [Cyclobacteriaceae bacterium]|nr:RsmB/NOP family class I SAM-dependent RNA methyltransferase [Cyclobacteriaceae bacterium]
AFLKDCASLVKPGGMMVYSTCSILPSENGLQVGQFLAAHAEYSLEEEKHCWPSEGFDGFYMALIKKK